MRSSVVVVDQGFVACMVCADGWWEEVEERMEMGCDEPGMVSMARWRAQGSVECDDGPGIYVTPRIDKRCESRSSSSLVEGGMEDRVGQTGYLYVSQLIK